MKASKCVVTYDEYVGIGNLSVNGCAVDRDITCVIGHIVTGKQIGRAHV